MGKPSLAWLQKWLSCESSKIEMLKNPENVMEEMINLCT
jgi:hypothetical protein